MPFATCVHREGRQLGGTVVLGEVEIAALEAVGVAGAGSSSLFLLRWIVNIKVETNQVHLQAGNNKYGIVARLFYAIPLASCFIYSNSKPPHHRDSLEHSDTWKQGLDWLRLKL